MHVIVKPALGVNCASVEIQHEGVIVATLEVSEVLGKVNATANVGGVAHGWNLANKMAQLKEEVWKLDND